MEEADKLHNQTNKENANIAQQDALKSQDMKQLALTTKRKSVESPFETKKKSRSSWSERLTRES